MEIGFLWNVETNEYLVLQGTINGISLSSNNSANILLRSHFSNFLVFMHNHPKNGLFSEVDLRTFITSSSLYEMTAACNDGTIYMMYKTENFNKEKVQDMYNRNVKKEMIEMSRIVRKLTTSQINKDRNRDFAWNL